MHCTRQIKSDLWWVGGNDRRLAMFEGVYSVPYGVSYNSYLLLDEAAVLFDTVDKSITKMFCENIAHTLGNRKLDYLIVQHMEPDHTAAFKEILERYPEAKIVCNSKIAVMIEQFFSLSLKDRYHIVTEGCTIETGRHKLKFLMAPMVHWPEVMVTYDETDGILFSADAFGSFGALNGAIFDEEVDFERDWLDEARRYYTNIVGKYGPSVQALLKKVFENDVYMVCPLHGLVLKNDTCLMKEKYEQWSSYTPEETGVMIAYASVYGNTENAAEILACKLRERGIKTCMFDTSVTPASEIVSAAFKWSHLVFASTTYNTGIFVAMENLLHDLAAHNLQNRTVAFIENGSWAPASGRLMRGIIEPLKNMKILPETVSIKSSLKLEQFKDIEALADAIKLSIG
jgi:flavorubredoxin